MSADSRPHCACSESTGQLLLSGLLATAALLVSYYRLYLGVDITDEAQYIAEAYVPTKLGFSLSGDLFIQQIPNLLLYPLLRVHTAFFGSSGLALLLRHLYWLAALLGASASFCFFSKRYSKADSLAVSSLVLLFVPFSIPSWGYNNLAYLGLPLGLLALFEFNATRVQALLGGAVLAYASASYPPLLPVFALAACGAWRAAAKQERRCLRIALAAATALLAALGAWVLLGNAAQLKRILEFSSWVGAVGGFWKLRLIIEALFAIHSPALLLALCMLATLAYRDVRRVRCRLVFFVAAVLLVTLALRPMTPAFYKIQFWITSACIMLGAPAAAYAAHAGQSRDAKLGWIFASCALAAAFFSYSSSNGLANAGLALMLPFQLLLLRWLGWLRESPAQIGRAAVPNIALTVIWIYFAVSSFNFIFREKPYSELTVRVPSGPYAGIYTDAEKARYLSTLQQELRELAANNAGTLFAAYAPAPYLMSVLKPQTSMLYAHPRNWPEEAIAQITAAPNSGRGLPDIIVTTKISGEQPFDAEQFERYFSRAAGYKLISDTDQYRIRARVSLPEENSAAVGR